MPIGELTMVINATKPQWAVLDDDEVTAQLKGVLSSQTCDPGKFAVHAWTDPECAPLDPLLRVIKCGVDFPGRSGAPMLPVRCARARTRLCPTRA